MLNIGFVNPLVSPEEISHGLKKHNLRSIAIYERQLTSHSIVKDRFKPNLFDETIYIEPDESLEITVNKLKSSKLHFLFNGLDISTPLTDKLAFHYPLIHTNDHTTSDWRYHKASAQKVLHQKQVQNFASIEIFNRELTAEDENRLAQWKFPVILKPANAGGTFGFYECHSVADVKAKLKINLSKIYITDIFSYIIQEKLVGEEFAIDTFSLDGKHNLIHIRKYTKKNFAGIPLAKYTTTILPTEELYTLLTNFIQKMLDTLGLKNGFCHTEVFLTANGPCAIDINPRLPGAKSASCILAKETYGYSHGEVMAHTLLNKPFAQKPHQHGRVVYLHNYTRKKLGHVNIDKVRVLPSFKECIQNRDTGTFLELPKELSDTILFVVLAHPDLQQIEQDCATLFSLEEKMELF